MANNFTEQIMSNINRKSVADLIDNVDTSYMTQAEKIMIQAQAERAEYIAQMLSSVFARVKSIFVSKKRSSATGLSHAWLRPFGADLSSNITKHFITLIPPLPTIIFNTSLLILSYGIF